MTFTAVIERLNLWGEHFARICWPLFWQSSILIAGMFLLDLLFRRKLRPSVRHALWLVVLIKLLLPPSLAFPTGLGWWLRTREAAPARQQVASYVVTYGPARITTPLPNANYASIPAPRTRLSTAAWRVLAIGGISLTLLLLLLMRWQRLHKQLRKSRAAPIWLAEMARDAQLKVRCRRPVRLMLTDTSISPALCGLFRPLIVLPSRLLERLTAAQLRAVVLHELIHLRNGDVWINCFQSLLQITFWWHPLVWFANARIRRIREEVVDDAVRLALGAEAETYAPTLLEVARLALSRPLATLGLVGILESRHALKQRVNRLVSFPAPRRAGLTLGSILGILAFTCIAVPMGQAPPKATKPANISDSKTTLTGAEKAATDPIWLIQPITSDGWVDYDMASGISTSTNGAVLTYRDTKLSAEHIAVDQQTGQIVAEGSVRLSSGFDIPMGGKLWMNMTNLQKLAQNQPSYINPSRSRQFSNNGRNSILNKLNTIRLDTVTFDSLPLSEVINYLREEAKKRDPEGKGINFLINPNADAPPGAIDPATGLAVTAPQTDVVDINGVTIKILPSLNDVRMIDVLDAIVKVADRRIRFSIEDYGVSFRLAGNEPPPMLFSRTIKVDPSVFAQGLESVAGVSIGNFQTGQGGGGGQQGNSGVTVPRVQATPNGTGGQGGQGGAQGGGGGISGVTRPSAAISPQAIRQFFVDAGVDLTPPKSAFYNDGSGTLLVHATKGELDIVENAVTALSATAEQSTAAVKSETSSNPVLSRTNESKVPVLGVLPVVGPLFQVRTGQLAAANSPQQITNVNTGTSDKLVTRIMKVNPDTFRESIRAIVPLPNNASPQETMDAFRKLVLSSGVELRPHANMFYSERTGNLFVRAIAPEVEAIEQMVHELNIAPEQVNIQARFVEISGDFDADALAKDFATPSVSNTPDGEPIAATVDTNSSLITVLADPQFRAIFHALEKRDGVDVLSEQNVTTLSGRQAQVQTTDVQTIVKLNPLALVPPGVASSNVYVTEPLYSGPVLDIIPYSAGKDDTLQLTISAKVTEFLGYDAPQESESVPVYLDGKASTIKPPHPRTHIRSLCFSVILHDGQTIVLGRPKDEMVTYDNEGNAITAPSTTKKNLLVFVTATLIDPAGNRLHSPIPPETTPRH